MNIFQQYIALVQKILQEIVTAFSTWVGKTAKVFSQLIIQLSATLAIFCADMASKVVMLCRAIVQPVIDNVILPLSSFVAQIVSSTYLIIGEWAATAFNVFSERVISPLYYYSGELAYQIGSALFRGISSISKFIWNQMILNLYTMINKARIGIYKTLIKPVYQLLKQGISLVFKYIIKPLRLFMGQISHRVWGALKIILSNTWGILKAILSTLREGIQVLISFVYEILVEPIFNGVLNVFTVINDYILQPIWGYFSLAAEYLAECFIWIMKFIVSRFSRFFDLLWQAASGMMKRLTNMIIRFGEFVRPTVEYIALKIGWILCLVKDNLLMPLWDRIIYIKDFVARNLKCALGHLIGYAADAARFISRVVTVENIKLLASTILGVILHPFIGLHVACITPAIRLVFFYNVGLALLLLSPTIVMAYKKESISRSFKLKIYGFCAYTALSAATINNFSAISAAL